MPSQRSRNAKRNSHAKLTCFASLILASLISSLLSTPQAFAQSTSLALEANSREWLAEGDKNAHMMVSGAGTVIFHVGLRALGYSKWESMLGAGSLMAMVGVLKEMRDPAVSEKDLAANGLGIAAGMGAVFILDWDW